MNADFEVPAEISGGGRRLLDLLAELPLATTRDLTALAGVGSSVTYKRLGELRDLGLLDSASLGWCCSLSMRWFLTDMALSVLSRLGTTWHQEFSRCRLLERLPSVEWFYQVVSQIEDIGPFEAFHWMNGVSLDAVACYQHGWVALFWSGSFQSEDWIASRLGRLARDLRDLSISLDAPWPGLLAFVVNDEWQRELVYRAARRYHLEDQVAVWCARDGSRSGAAYCRASRGWVYQPVYFGDTGGWGWKRRLEASPWVEKRGEMLGRVLDIVSQWPGATLDMARQSLDEGSKGKSAQNSCKVLYDLGFGPARAAQPPGGPWANARILRRAWPSSAYEGWPRLRLMTSFRAWRTTRPGRLMTPKRTAFSLLLTHSFPKANCFIAEFRLKGLQPPSQSA